MIKNTITGCLALAALASGGVASATSIPIANPGFEADVLACAGGFTCFDFGVVPGWGGGSGTTFKPSVGAGGEYPGGVPEGVNVLATGDPSTFAEISQDLGIAPTPNTTYTLRVNVGQRTDAPLTAYFVQLLVGTTVVLRTPHLNQRLELFFWTPLRGILAHHPGRST
jgi:hypothetical protein